MQVSKTISLVIVLITFFLVVSGCVKKSQVVIPVENSGALNENLSTLERMRMTLNPSWTVLNQSSLKKDLYLNWLREDDSKMPITQAEQLNIILENTSQKSKDEAISKVTSYFEKNGFKINSTNTRKESEVGVDSDIYYGFEAAGEKCVIKTIIDTSFFIVTCAFLKEIDEYIYNEFNTIFDDSLYWIVEKVEKNFAIGQASSGRGGYLWIAKNVNNHWEFIFKGAEQPLCKILEDNNVPKSIYTGRCWK